MNLWMAQSLPASDPWREEVGMIFCYTPSGWGPRIGVKQNKQKILVDERFEKLSDVGGGNEHYATWNSAAV